ncbi:MAG TPA: glutamine synthetase III [Chitinivibrionales bacterium]|nr:glutamine synthetase III [Chitinivibrionales bacterium]
MSNRYSVTHEIGCAHAAKKTEFNKVSEYFGINTFGELVMKKMVSEKTYKAYKKWQDEGAVISSEQADEIANAMKEWAISKGATAYTHWFQPMTGLTAEKHDSFITINGVGQVIEKFSGSKLIQGEPDASSFPSGGIRATFEARGYTAWDPSSPAFIAEVDRGRTLCIPSIFISYNGEALDKKLPLLKSDLALNNAALATLKLFGHADVKNVYSTCGPEQEYFLIDDGYYKLRPDLQLTGRTLVGAASPKGQQLEDQYLGSIKERMLNYMNDLTEEAYKLGIPVCTRHNEVAPHQYELAPIFEKSNIAVDHNILLMHLMNKVARRYGLVCLLHEKPFAGINGSGKHLNWSLADDRGTNLLNPGDTPEENLLFLTVLVSVISAVYKHADLLRAAVATAGNEHRLGANEAPPAIVSIYLGKQLAKIMEQIESGKLKKVTKQDIVDMGVHLLPKFMRDTSDRNRTSTFAFTGSKFEFRAVGSSMNIATSVTVINTIVAESLTQVTAKIRSAAKGNDFDSAVMAVLSETIRESRPILFEGNNYSDEWVKEAAKRKLPNVASSPEALKAFIRPDTLKLFEKHAVFTPVELNARYNIWLDIYEKVLIIEAKALAEMVNSMIIPKALEFEHKVGESLKTLESFADFRSDEKTISLPSGVVDDRKDMLAQLSADIFFIRKNIKEMHGILKHGHDLDPEKKTELFFKELKPQMEHIRKHVDELETMMPDDMWLLPKYREMLFIS